MDVIEYNKIIKQNRIRDIYKTLCLIQRFQIVDENFYYLLVKEKAHDTNDFLIVAHNSLE